MASLALANLKRLEMELRNEAWRVELRTAAEAQQRIMPARQTQHGPFRCIGHSRPGQYVGGDFFALIPLSDMRIAVALGDVAGKGITASVLMTATHGFLHAALKYHGDPGRAVTDANRFVNPRRPDSKFVTMWVGVLDADTGMLSYVDAGHSYALIKRADGSFERLDRGGGLPIGVDPDLVYKIETVPVGSGDKLLVVSDGIIEQFGSGLPPPGQPRPQFEMTGVQASLEANHPDEVAALFNAVIAHAGTDQLSDDATAVLVRL
jgi:sigma-B regulation protein RsbU (phosphoserine phosphatase)